jgi:hypothetical protein
MHKILWCYLSNSPSINIDRGLLQDIQNPNIFYWFVCDFKTKNFSCYSISEEEREIMERDHSQYAIISGSPENFSDPFTTPINGIDIIVYDIEPIHFHQNKPIIKSIPFSEIESMEINKNFISY